MSDMANTRKIEFKTLDGITLRGIFYPPSNPNSPVIILTAGLSLLKEHHIDAFAQRFQAAGFAALIYDHRNWGSSDGEPRCETDLWIVADDYHEAISFARSLAPEIDPSRVCIWGAGHSGGYVMLAGAVDPRVKVVVSMVPFISGNVEASFYPKGTLEKAWADREKRAVSGVVDYAPVWSDTREQALAEGNSKRMIGPVEAYDYFVDVKKRSDAAGTPWSNVLSTRTFINLQKWEPRAYVERISPKPFLYVVANQDKFIPLQMQMETYNRAGEPKELVRIDNSEHLDTYTGKPFEENVEKQIAFLRKWL